MTLPISDPNYSAYALPAVMNPPDALCFTIKVPNDQGHIAAFFGALFELTQWIAWQRDPARRGREAAAVWRDIWVDLKAQSCNPPILIHGMEIEEMSQFRVDCDCNVFVTCCDGTEKQILTSDQVQKLINGGDVIGAPQPKPNGGTQCYNLSLQASQVALIPVPVSTGDVLSITSAVGAGSDGTPNWNCPDGSFFIAGACLSGGTHNPSDPIPTINHMRLIYKIGSNYYDAMSGPFTVPSGVSAVQPLIQVNDSPISDDSGTYQINVCVTNNSVGTWTSVFDFMSSAGPFTASFINPGDTGSTATWAPTVGWKPGLEYESGANETFKAIFLKLDGITPYALDTFDFEYDYTPGSFVGSGEYGALIDSINGGTTHIVNLTHPSVPGGSSQHFTGTPALSNQTALHIYMACGTGLGTGDPGGDETLVKLTITGHGPKPSIFP